MQDHLFIFQINTKLEKTYFKSVSSWFCRLQQSPRKGLGVDDKNSINLEFYHNILWYYDEDENNDKKHILLIFLGNCMAVNA